MRDQSDDGQTGIASVAGAQLRRLAAFALALISALVAWAVAARLSGLPPFILPPPALVAERLLEVLQDGSLLHHAAVTLTEVVVGLGLGGSAAMALGYGIAKSPLLERVLAPYIVASQSIPVVAIAPLLVIWFGSGRLSKVIVASLIVFFPVLVNTVVGVRSVPAELRSLMRSLRATRMQTFIKLDVPAAMPILLGGVKVGATLSVIGAVVGEFVGSDEGLGYLINLARGMYDTPLVFVAIISLIVMALTLYGLVSILEAWLLAWQDEGGQPA